MHHNTHQPSANNYPFQKVVFVLLFFFNPHEEFRTPARWECSYNFDYSFILLIMQLRLLKAYFD